MNDSSQTFFCMVYYPDVMATKGCSFQDDEKTIIVINTDMDIVAQKEKNE